MRKLFTIIFLALICLNAMAYDFSAVCGTGQTLYYNITSNVEPYTVEVTSENTDDPYYTTYPTGDLVIPETVEYNSITYSVTSIDENAFYECSELTSVSIPNSVTSIGERAFNGCIGLASVTLPNSVESIGNYVFFGCSGLTSITIPESVESIGDMAFYGCNELNTVNFNATNCVSMNSSFADCEALSTLNIGENVTNIPEYAFIRTYITNINAYPYTPPTIDNSSFETDVFLSANVYTPCEAAESYRNDNGWRQFENIQGDTTANFSITVQSQNETMGSVTGGGENFSCETETTITATPATGYRFVQWNDGNTDNPRTIIVISDSTFVATFRSDNEIVCDNPCPAVTDQPMSETAIPYYATEELVFNIGEDVDVCITIKCPETINVEVMGTPAEATITDMTITEFLNLPDGLSYCVSLVDMNPTTNNYATLHITGVPTAAGEYQLNLSCNVSGTASVLGYDQPMSNQAITFDPGIDFIILEQGIKLIRVLSNNDAYGSVYGGGTYDEGSTATISATPYQGYRFVSWNDNITDNPRTITVTSHSTFVANFVEESESPAVYWRCTFEESTPLYTMGQITASDANWELQTISESAGANYYYNLNSYGENHPYGEVSETPEHWMMIDGDGANQDGYDFDSYLLFSGIDLSDAEYPQICFYECRSLYNMPSSMEATVVEVSIDGGTTWTKHVVGCEEMTTENKFTYRQVLILEAAGNENVMIRFRANRQLSVIQASYGSSSVTYESAPFIVNWQVDDIVIKATPAFDLAITDVRMNDGICDKYSNQDYSNELGTSQYNYYQFKPMFGQTPRSEWTSPNKYASFNVAVENRGYETVTPIVHISVTSPSGLEIWNVDFTGDEIEMFQCDTIDVIEYLEESQIDKVFRFTEVQMQNIEIGEYIVTYSVSIAENEDHVPEDNVRSHPFYITESGYSPATPNITTTSGPNRWSSFEEGGEILAVFEYNVLPEDEIPLYVYISGNTEVGSAIAVNIYEYNEVTSDFEISFTSGRYTIEEDDLGTWINIPFATPLILTDFDSGSETKKIRVGIAFYENGNNELHIGASEEMPNKGWICLYDMNGEGANYVNVRSESAAPAICLGVPFSVHTITALANNGNYGYVTGSGTYEEGTEITLTAIPYEGYKFISWNDGNVENPRTITITSDSTFVANFEEIPTYTIVVQSNNETYGSVSGGGTYDEGSTATISATPYQGYRFVQWDDNNTDNPRTITVTSDITIIAIFEEVPSYTITVQSNNESYGSVSGGGTYEEGSTATLTAMPYEGYSFVSWNDGDESSPRTIVVTSDSTFIADFVKCEITYAIDTVVNNFVTVGDHTFYSTGNYSFAVLHETACDTIFDIRLRVLAEPVYDIGPNPAKSLLNINSDGFISAVEFYSVTGQLVMRKEVNGYEAEFDVEGLVDGVYILRIYGAESSLPSTYKIIKE